MPETAMFVPPHRFPLSLRLDGGAKMMRKLIALGALASGLWATYTRVITLGGFGDYLTDDGNTEIYPTQAYFFPNIVVGELGTGDFTKGLFRLNLQIGDEGRFGAFFLAPNKSPGGPLSWRIPYRYYPNPGVEAGYFKDIGNLLLGFHLGYMGSYASETGKPLKRSDLFYGRGGVGWLIEGMPTEVSLAYYSFTARNDSAGSVLDAGSAIEGHVRSLWPISDQTAMVVSVYYYDDDLSDDLSSNNKYREFGASLGFNTTPVSGYTIITGLNYWGYDESAISTTFEGISGSAGLEASITRFLLFRMGANKYIWGREESPNKKKSIVPFYYNFGLGIRIEELLIDGYINKELLFEGPYFIGGKETGLFGSVSVKYHFKTF